MILHASAYICVCIVVHGYTTVAILSKFTVLCLSSYFVVHFLKLKLSFFIIEPFIITQEYS